MAFEHRIRRRVEFSDTDMAGIVHFAQFFRYMEAAEHDFFRSLGFSVVTQIGEEHYGWPRVQAACDYVKPLHFEDEFGVHLLVKQVRSRSIAYEFLFTAPGGEPLARGSMTTVCVQRRGPSIAAVPIPQALRNRLEPAPPELLAALPNLSR